MKKYTKILLIALGILILAGIVFYSGSIALFQGSLKLLPSYDKNKCYDSDGGKNYEEKGVTYGEIRKLISRGPKTQHTDYCVGNKLIEYYCDGNQVKKQQIDCELGCDNDVCVKKTVSAPEAGEQCKDSIDNDNNGYFDCYDPNCSDYYVDWGWDCSKYINAKTYTGPGVYTLKGHDRIKFNNGLIAELDTLKYFDNPYEPVSFKIYYEKENKIVLHPKGVQSIRKPEPTFPYIDNTNTMFNITLPFFNLYGAYVYLLDADLEKKEIKVEVLDNCTEIYNKCLKEPNLSSEEQQYYCEKFACHYEAFKPSLEKQENGDFTVIYPKSDKKFADIVMKYLPNCYDQTAKLFNSPQDINQAGIFFFNSSIKENTVLGSTEADKIYIEYKGNLEEELMGNNYNGPEYWEDQTKPCGAIFYPMGHEMVHVMHFGTIIPPNLHEGLASYLAGKVNGEGFYALVCEDDYYYNKNEFDADGNLKKTMYENTTNNYILGKCFWQLLEKKYGWGKMDELFKKIGQLKSIPNVYGEKYDFIKDVIILTFGESEIDYIKSIAKKLNGLEIDCQFEFGGFNSYSLILDCQTP